MPSINPNLVPTIAPGSIFSTFTEETSLNIRWYMRQDPVHFETLNRPLADIVVRQLIMAKALDTINLSLGYQATFPFVTQPRIAAGSSTVDVPDNWIWDMHVSAPAKWENFRLAKIKRISGENGTTEYTGSLRLIFTANQENSAIEVALFYADYEIDSVLTYQRNRITIVDDSEDEPTYISPSESETINGFITFRTLDLDLATVQDFLEVVVPDDLTDSNSDGFYDTPAVYELADSVAGTESLTGDFDLGSMDHGSGLLTDSVENSIPSLDSDVQSWITSFNYPFDADANLTASGTYGITIPSGLFREFDITAPAGDSPTGSSSGLYYPVWVSRIEITDTAGDTMLWYFATYNTLDEQPSVTPIEFAYIELQRTMTEGTIVAIVPFNDLKNQSNALFNQHFGRGHVVLSSVWGGTSDVIDEFFDAFDPIPGDNPEVEFSIANTRIGSFGISRVPKYTPTSGENQALRGTTSRLTVPVPPSSDNLYVTEQDQGLGNEVDLAAITGITSHQAISRYGYTGALGHKIVRLCLDRSKITTSDTSGSSDFYTVEILPRLTELLGRPPTFGDFWFDGTLLLFFNGDTWQN